MDRPTADHAQDLVADPLQPQPALDERPVQLGKLDGAPEAQEIGRVEQVDVERVALDPLAAVQQAP